MAQSNSIDPRLKARFTQDQLSDMQANAPSRLAFWTYYLDQSYSIVDIPSEKAEALSSLELMEIPSSQFNGFSMLLDEYQKQGATFRFKGEDKMLIIKPMEQFINEFNAFYQSNKK
jgi:type II secretory pathway component GspD/PulD (secretin)